MSSLYSPFIAVALNPQPLPPRFISRFDAVLLNPQPLPPRYLSLR
jgi:hypothetical protein